jgi:hypothetical protein
MGCEHPRDHGGLKIRLVVTSMNDSGPRNSPSGTILADSAVTVTGGGGTHQAGIMQRLHGRNLLLMAEVVSSWRNERKCIMKVNYVRLFALQEQPQCLCGIAGPDRSQSDLSLAQKPAFNELVVVPCVFQHLVAGRAQELLFAVKDFILSTREAVVVVYHQHFHCT